MSFQRRIRHWNGNYRWRFCVLWRQKPGKNSIMSSKVHEQAKVMIKYFKPLRIDAVLNKEQNRRSVRHKVNQMILLGD
ncbi:hypothetical protein AVEN_250660-1, partial [Araneus ventricosus]